MAIKCKYKYFILIFIFFSNTDTNTNIISIGWVYTDIDTYLTPWTVSTWKYCFTGTVPRLSYFYDKNLYLMKLCLCILIRRLILVMGDDFHSIRRIWFPPLIIHDCIMTWKHFLQSFQTDTLRNNCVVITSKRRHLDVITSKWRRFDVITTLL